MLRRIAGKTLSDRHHAEPRGFNLDLPLIVEGPDIDGSLFREETTVPYMSYSVALFPLRNLVALGSRLKLTVRLPPKLAEDKDIALVVKGTVVYIDDRIEGAPSRISVRLENRYAICAGEAGGPESRAEAGPSTP